jgi:two-component system nitrogen regulation sensor histidine kinase NtrY
MEGPDQHLLQVILDSTSAALLVVGETGRILFTNLAARQLFFEGREARGENFLLMLGNVSEPLRQALTSETDQIFTYDDPGGEPETYHLARSDFSLAGEPHTLISVRHMTVEISRQELSLLKRTLRIIGHELSNSMAPASSLLRSARLMLSRPEMHPRLEKALQTVEERLVHLHDFLAGLAQLGQLPRPRQREVPWAPFVEGLRALWPDVAVHLPDPHPESAWFDPVQIQQVLINLVKNAHEAGGPGDGVAIELEPASERGGVRFAVLDRGPGMSEDVLSRAMLPAFTTKDRGSGMGLTLCREVVSGHGGRLRIDRREGGGTAVGFWLPSRTAEPAINRARLTLTGSR